MSHNQAFAQPPDKWNLVKHLLLWLVSDAISTEKFYVKISFPIFKVYIFKCTEENYEFNTNMIWLKVREIKSMK